MTFTGGMARLCAAAAITLLVLARCSSEESPPPPRTPVAPASVFHERMYPFCKAGYEDRFLLGYTGDSLPGNTVHFYIVCHSGDTIFHESWKAEDFLGGKGNLLPTQTEKTAFIEERMKDFIGKKSHSPAMTMFDSIPGAPANLSFSWQVGDQPPALIMYDEPSKKVLRVY